MGSRHRERSRDRDRRDKDRDRDRRRRSRSRDRRSRSKDRHRHRDRSKDRHHDKHSRSRDRSREKKSRDKSRDKTSSEREKQANLLDALTSIATATSRNFSALVGVKDDNGLGAGMFNNQMNNGQNMMETEAEREERKRKKRSRWGGSEHEKTFIPGMPTILPNTLNKEQEEAYLIQLQIEEVSRKLRSGDLGIPPNPEDRSPSPEPIYSSDGKRLNTREFRTRRRLEEERHALVLRMQSINPDFKPPIDYKPPVIRVNDKVMIPQEEHPEINFVGLLIGPRGNTLKTMEKETGAKIIIRGKGSVKEGKVGRKDGQPLPGEDEPLHAYITATNPEHVKKAVERIKEVIRQGVEVPENQNDLRRMQLRELAQLNGTLRENDGPRCSNCGATDHKSWLCPDKPNVTNNIVCTICGGAGHIARDCRTKRFGAMTPTNPQQAGDKAKIDEEYMSLMAELGEGPPPDSAPSGQSIKRSVGYPGVFDRQMVPRPIMGAPPPPGRPDMQVWNGPQMPPPSMIPNALPPPPPWGNPQGGPPVMGPPGPWQSSPCPPGMMPPPPPPGATSPPNIPPLLPWMNGNNQPPPPGSQPPVPPPGMMAPPPSGNTGNMIPPPPVQWGQGPPPPPPGIDINTLAGLPNLLAAPPPPPPSS